MFDFGHFVLEQLAYEFRRRTRKNDLLTASRVVHFQDPRTDTVADPDIFLGYHFGTRQTGFDLARFDNGIALVHALDGARYDVFPALEEIVQYLLAFGVADFLQNGLLGSLRADAAEFDGLKGVFDVIADFDAGDDFLGFGIELLLIRLLQACVVGHDEPATESFVLAGSAIDGYTYVSVFLEALFHGRRQSVL